MIQNAYTAVRNRVIMKYRKTRLKRIPFDIRKEKYEEIKAAAVNAGESVNGYIKKSVEMRMHGAGGGMNHIRASQLKKCIFLEAEEFDRTIKEATNTNIEMHLSLDGISYFYENDEEIDVNEALSSYYGVTVTSIHADDCEYPGIWVVYR